MITKYPYGSGQLYCSIKMNGSGQDLNALYRTSSCWSYELTCVLSGDGQWLP